MSALGLHVRCSWLVFAVLAGCDAPEDQPIARELAPEEDADDDEEPAGEEEPADEEDLPDESSSEDGSSSGGHEGETETDADADAPPAPREGECTGSYGMDCVLDGEAGRQYCYQGLWGPCLMDAECVVGDWKTEECATGPEELTCELYGGVPAWSTCGFTPLVLSFDGAEPTFDAAPRAFELGHGDDSCLARSWPGADTPWLAIDLDGNGGIDDGHELFGSVSPTHDGRRPSDGFDALAEHDADGDGAITPADPVWSALLLWSDLDRDRASSAVELVPLVHSGITEIALAHVVEPRCDAEGNCGIERAAFAFAAAGGSRRGTIIDVHIPCD